MANWVVGYESPRGFDWNIDLLIVDVPDGEHPTYDLLEAGGFGPRNGYMDNEWMGYSIWRTDGVHGYSLGRRWELSGRMKRILRQMVREKEYITWAKLQSLANRPVFPESHAEPAGRQEERRVPAVKTQALASMGGSDVPMDQATPTISPTNPAYSPQPEREPLAIEGSELWGDPITRRFRLATTANEFFAWLVARLRGESLIRDDLGIVVRKSGVVWRYNLRPIAGGLEVEAVLLNREEYDAFKLWVELSLVEFCRPPEATPEQRPMPDGQAESEAPDPLAAIPSVKVRNFVRRYNAGEHWESLGKDYGLNTAHAVGTYASNLRKAFPGLVEYRRKEGNWGEDDDE